MRQVKLTGKTRKGKNRVGNSGPLWNVVEGAAERLTPFRDDQILLKSLDGRDMRWVNPKPGEDEHFIVEFV